MLARLNLPLCRSIFTGGLGIPDGNAHWTERIERWFSTLDGAPASRVDLFAAAALSQRHIFVTIGARNHYS